MDALLMNLRQAFADASKGEQGEAQKTLVSSVQGYLRDYVDRGHQDWRDYRLFAPCKYARNLVDISMDFEAIVLCWDDNQAQNCWFVVLEGVVSEVYYKYDALTRKVEEARSADSEPHFVAGQVGYIKDDIALHKVGSVGGKACTLHIYNKPIPFCNIYDPVSGEVLQRKSGFFSVKGRKVDPDTTCLYQTIYQQVEKMLPAEITDPMYSVPPLLPLHSFKFPLPEEGEEKSKEVDGSCSGDLTLLLKSAKDGTTEGKGEGEGEEGVSTLQETIFGSMGSIFSMVSESISHSSKEEFSW